MYSERRLTGRFPKCKACVNTGIKGEFAFLLSLAGCSCYLPRWGMTGRSDWSVSTPANTRDASLAVLMVRCLSKQSERADVDGSSC